MYGRNRPIKRCWPCSVFFMLKRGRHYQDSATDYEALSVQRNAPRWIKALTRFGFIPATA